MQAHSLIINSYNNNDNRIPVNRRPKWQIWQNMAEHVLRKKRRKENHRRKERNCFSPRRRNLKPNSESKWKNEPNAETKTQHTQILTVATTNSYIYIFTLAKFYLRDLHPDVSALLSIARRAILIKTPQSTNKRSRWRTKSIKIATFPSRKNAFYTISFFNFKWIFYH